MSGLREALEKLAAELEYDVAGAPGKIRALLAAYPAEPGPPTREQVEEVLGDHAENNVIDCICGWRDDEHNDDGDHLRHQAKELREFITEYGKVEK